MAWPPMTNIIEGRAALLTVSHQPHFLGVRSTRYSVRVRTSGKGGCPFDAQREISLVISAPPTLLSADERSP